MEQIKDEWIKLVRDLQNEICQALESRDGKAVFEEEEWERKEGGGGITRVIANGNVFEKGGVNTSVVHGKVNDGMRNQLKIDGENWFAAGISVVIHPVNPYVPTIHCNYRMFELYNGDGHLTDRWFGGGTDLTPCYLFPEDAIAFHRLYKVTLDAFDQSFFDQFKKSCDDYFVNTHRNNERRGIGGIFYDYKRPDKDRHAVFWMDLAKACGKGFIASYIPIVDKRKDIAYGEKEKYWQEIRRGRYVEFNLVHDRGTLFGLKTNGRIESILMSLPPTVRFEYNQSPVPGSEEEELLKVCLAPVDWANL
ncbi:MAG: oxygen-dependent coproporphyrinogen oxidase [Gemmatimonadaceae bacterium]|nr:oxygen-dependent coproporphyrinogen oxidase [Chitinophagaceae bacterium]